MFNNQYGRSMIEMLGVLSIIGVLSVGGIAGFSGVMTQYKVNKTVEQVMEMVSVLAQIGEQSGTYEGLSNAVAIKMKAIPNGISIDGNNLTNLFGGKVTITPSGLLSSNDNGAFAVTFTGLSSDACLRLATQNWQSGQSGSLVGIGFATNTSTESTRERTLERPIMALPERAIEELPERAIDILPNQPIGTLPETANTSPADSLLLNCNDVGCAKNLPISITNAIEKCGCESDTCIMVVKFF